MYKSLADNTLMSMTKKELIERLRIAEHNHRVCEEQIDQQYKNCMELLKKEREETIDECIKKMMQTNILIASDEWSNEIVCRAKNIIKKLLLELKEQR